MTSAGHLPAHLHRAIASGNLLAARSLAAELPRLLSLDEALAVLVLIAEREPANSRAPPPASPADSRSSGP
jgi:hypothetical protein